MKEYLRQLTEGAANDLGRACLAREYLQARILEYLQDRGVFQEWAFVGGTALRFLYGIPRFSEDLDFSFIAAGRGRSLQDVGGGVQRALAKEGYRVELTLHAAKTVAAAFVKFPGLPHELGFSPHVTQALAVRVEVDTNPPAGARIETSTVRRHVTLRLSHHDRASLLSGKLHAVLTRRWSKGRDLYDLAWYLAEPTWPAPNLPLLNAGLAQAGWQGPPLESANWRALVRERLASIDWARAQADVRPFLEREQDMELVDREVLLGLLTETDSRP